MEFVIGWVVDYIDWNVFGFGCVVKCLCFVVIDCIGNGECCVIKVGCILRFYLM